MMKSTWTCLLAGAAALLSEASAASYVAQFDEGLGGFTTEGFAIRQSQAGSLKAGGSGGFLEVKDDTWGDGVLTLSGDLIGGLRPGGAISFDAISLGSVIGKHSGFGRITLEGAGMSVTLDAIAGVPALDVWSTFSVALDAATWGMSEKNFAALLGDLQVFSMVLETKNGLGERIGFDNFSFTSGSAVPTPAAVLLFGPAIAVAAFRRSIARQAAVI